MAELFLDVSNVRVVPEHAGGTANAPGVAGVGFSHAAFEAASPHDTVYDVG